MLISFSIKKDLIYIPLFIIINGIYDKLYEILKLSYEFVFLIRFCSKIILIIFYFIEKNSLSEEGINAENKVNEKLLDTEENYKSKIIFYLLLSLIISSFNYFHLMTMKIKVDEINFNIVLIVFLFILDSIMFEKQIYSHQILSIIIIIIGNIIYFFLLNFKSKPLYIIFCFLKCYCLAFNRLLIRYISINYFINIFLIAFLIGLNGILYILIRSLINKDFIQFPNINFNPFIFFVFFISSILNFFVYYKIIYKLGPIHGYISDFIALIIANKILQIGKTKKEKINLNNLIIMIIYIISMLIYFEIIQLNFCNLNKNIKKKIQERSTDDTNKLVLNSFISDSDSANDIE